MIWFVVVFGLALSGGQGAPSTAVYKFVKCNPEGDQANCITHQTANMEWSQDLPTKLPASAAQYLEAEPVEDERDPEEEDIVEEESLSAEDKSPEVYLSEDGSGDEGSGFMADRPFSAEDGSGNLFDKIYKSNKGGRKNEQKPAKKVMQEDFLL
ncbi:serglycin [Eucyclogobius newberryi]|uniref:serglycin n=1 Tax=Eucyclogobius newberryi TaxID=166745 RepID=UPI003B59C4F2